ncbi:hypothetical protein WN944_016105 [Citrus x changshan-huyou]|uniref:ApaG domain-containing protein n=1 Tax=Citrus x changshan-huyou TaxID=2935761 RepID=A0AAP0MD22_9ROSI
MTFSSCLLQHRHWVIHAYNVVLSDVSGEAVIGMYPRFHPECISHLNAITNMITYSLSRLADPKGSPFEVEVAEFPLQQPDYIF